MLHIHWSWITRYINLRDYIKQECFLNLGPSDESVHHLGDEGHLRQQLVHYFWKGHINSMVVNRCQLERKMNRIAKLLQQSTHVCLNRIQALQLLIIVHEHVWVDFMNENFIPNVTFDFVSCSNHVVQLLAGTLVIGIVSVNDIYESSTLMNIGHWFALQNVVTREVIHIELNITVIVHFLLLDIRRRQQKECFVRWHFLKDDFGNTCLARFGHTH